MFVRRTRCVCLSIYVPVYVERSLRSAINKCLVPWPGLLIRRVLYDKRHQELMTLVYLLYTKRSHPATYTVAVMILFQLRSSVPCTNLRGGSRGGGGGGVWGLQPPPFIYGNAPSSAKQPLPLPRFLYRA